jgi:oxazoline/thiazoline dehydrogenase
VSAPALDPPIRLGLADGARVWPQSHGAAVRAAWAEHRVHARSATAAAAFETLAARRSIGEGDVERQILGAEGVDELARFCLDATTLVGRGLVRLSAHRDGGSPVATLEPISPRFRSRTPALTAATPVRPSRFALVRRDDARRLVAESPLGLARVQLEDREVGGVLHALAQGGCADDVAAATGLSPREALAVLVLLVRAGVAAPLDAGGRLPEDADETLRQWDPHDLQFHTRSRLGRTDQPVGGRFRFLGELPPQPAVKETAWPVAVELPRPDLARAAAADPPFTAVLEARRSVRLLRGARIDVARLGELLYRAARVRAQWSDPEKGAFTSRPYPSGGASYELELYVNAANDAAIAPGFYWYDPVRHALRRVREPNEDTEALMREAHQATAGLAWPQLLLVVAARFQRVAWKYDAMAYATILKNTGALYATLYLAATAMGLAPCALGIGDADRFSRIAGTRYEQETSVGEFMLCGDLRPSAEPDAAGAPHASRTTASPWPTPMHSVATPQPPPRRRSS